MPHSTGQRFCSKRCAGLATSIVGKIQTEKFEAEIDATPRRKLKGRLVYVPAGEQPFVIGTRMNGDRHKRRGEIRTCVKCGDEYWVSHAARADQSACSRACGAEKMRRKRHSNSLAKGGPQRASLDKWFSLIVRSIGYCQCCGRTDMLQCAHIVSRRYLGVRWAFDNAMCLCAACHMRFTHRPIEWDAYVTETIGEAAYADIKRRALAFKGPVDRAAVAEGLYTVALEKGLTMNGVPGWSGWTSLKSQDDESVA